MKRRAGRAALARRRYEAHNRAEWSKEALELLGNAPDDKVARVANVDRETVLRARRRCKIPAFKARRGRVAWTDDMLALLGTDTDGNVAAMLGLGLGSVNRKRRMLGIPAFVPRVAVQPALEWTPAIVRRLGTVPEGRLAEELGVSPTTDGRTARACPSTGVPACV